MAKASSFFGGAFAVLLALSGTANAENPSVDPNFPNFALGYWKLNVRGWPSYEISAELLEGRGSYRIHIAKEKPCNYDVLPGDNAGEYRYVINDGSTHCNNGIFTLSPRDDGALNFHWSRKGESGTNTLGPDDEKMREYRLASGLSKPVTETAVIEGEWAGEIIIGGMARSAKALLTATAAGARLELNSIGSNCSTMILPTSADGTFDTFLYRSNGCGESKVALTMIGDDQLEITIVATGKSGTLRRLSGSAAASVTVPPTAFRNVALGMALADIDSAVEGKPRIGPESTLQYDLKAGSFMGVANLPFLDAQYRTVHYPLTHDRYPPDLDEDNIAAYALDGKVAAIMRVYTPVQETAPGMDAFKDALLSAYGEPSAEKAQGPTLNLSWHYGQDGKILSGQQAQASCIPKPYSNTPYARQIGMKYRWYERMMDLSVRRQTEAPSFVLHPVSGCGTSVHFTLTKRQDGSLSKVQSIAFVHEPIAAAIWEDRRPRIEGEINERIKLQTNRETIAPKL